MHVIVLVKQVPDVSNIPDDAWDREKGTLRRALLDSGLQPGNVTVEELCTAHNLDTFYSHRGEAGQCGLFGAVLGLRDA